MSKNDGGPAFPASESEYTKIGELRIEHEYLGMSLRDYFAAAALTGIVASSTEGTRFTNESVAKGAYDYADAMLAERSKE